MRIKELERIYGIQNGGDRKSDTNNFNPKYPDAPKTEKEFADRLGITQQTIQNYKKLTEMIPELEDLVDTGIVTKTTALARRQSNHSSSSFLTFKKRTNVLVF